jgi:hypothetical protein
MDDWKLDSIDAYAWLSRSLDLSDLLDRGDESLGRPGRDDKAGSRLARPGA